MEEDENLNPFERTQQMPLYKKGEEIMKIVAAMLELVPEGSEELEETVRWMNESAMTMCVKISGAEGGDMYDIRMECATLIRKAAHELIINLHSLEMFGYQHTEYFPLLREAVEEYRLLFVDWVNTFDPWNYYIDRWGLFNPPGVSAHDKDPDDDIPFNPDDFFDAPDDDDEA